MALSLSNFLVTLLLLLPHGLLTAVRGETVILDWQIGWTTANPDGLFERQVIGINGQWPLPFLNFTRGDRVVVNMHNQLNESSSLHFHGLFQKGTNHFDGPPGVTQCDIPPGSTVQYNFSLDQSGTYWYHSHSQAQYPDGLRQQFIITDPDSPYRDQYDDERAFTLSDWYHDGMNTLVAQYINYTNPTGVEPVPKSVLMNDTQNLTVSVQPGKTYLFRLSNVGAFAGQYFWIEGHRMKIIEVDGVYTEPKETDMIYISAAQRYGFLVTARNDSSANFAMVGSMDTELFDKVPATLNYNVTGWLVYDDTAPKPGARPVDEYTPLDDMTLVPYDKLELYDDVDHTINLDVTMGNLGDGANYAFFNNVTYVSPVVPTLYSALTTGGNASDVAVYGSYTNSFVLQKDEVVEIVLYNNDIGKHPFHLHGHNFQAVVRSDKGAGPYDPYNHPAFATVPMRRDTFMVQPRGNFVLRFKADNPGVWFFHCHIYWHLAAGLSATLIEAPLELQKMLSIPGDFIAACRAGGAAVAGNAAGNTVNVLDLTGENQSVPPLPAGFTARGIVALVLSCLSAIIGMAVIAWYGAAPLSSAELAATQRFIAKAGGSAT